MLIRKTNKMHTRVVGFATRLAHFMLSTRFPHRSRSRPGTRLVHKTCFAQQLVNKMHTRAHKHVSYERILAPNSCIYGLCYNHVHMSPHIVVTQKRVLHNNLSIKCILVTFYVPRLAGFSRHFYTFTHILGTNT